LILPARLPAGRSLVQLRAVEPAEPGQADDTRLLTIAVEHLAMKPGGQ
jgi:hypothetical protein